MGVWKDCQHDWNPDRCDECAYQRGLAERDAEIARLREALTFYADPQTWKPHIESGPIADDDGARAREALAASPAPTK